MSQTIDIHSGRFVSARADTAGASVCFRFNVDGRPVKLALSEHEALNLANATNVQLDLIESSRGGK